MDIERVKFERTGGFAGIRLTSDFRLDELPEDQARILTELLDGMNFDKLPKHLGVASSLADGFTYEITVETKGWKNTVTLSEGGSLPDKMDSLLELLNQVTRERARKK